ncbi:hypothetical protein FLW53_39825 [Microbispora sp. SCL1-1]|uniref:hypothetical protein n=1 Tax=unclassified Microbispora TaxID=2614687 RepID=UPI001158003F|nr:MULTISPECIES: hypothetical protein [unclassified Microbispora]NJP30239.1 hypothetical protein [Microbispora sp. CL1-1]TQS02373.1 hypothetical protein FLW53_39825 [Microbispora sp. SCL1-1]
MTRDIASEWGWAPSACTLPTVGRPLRLAEFDALFAEAVQAVRRPGRELLRLELAFSPEHAARAAELTARETGCCSFFTFTLTIADGGLALEVAVPLAQTEVLDALQARATASAAPAPAVQGSAASRRPA